MYISNSWFLLLINIGYSTLLHFTHKPLTSCRCVCEGMVPMAWTRTKTTFSSCSIHFVELCQRKRCSSGQLPCLCHRLYVVASFLTPSGSSRTCYDTTFCSLTTSLAGWPPTMALMLSIFTMRWGATSTSGCRMAFTGMHRHTAKYPVFSFITFARHGMWSFHSEFQFTSVVCTPLPAVEWRRWGRVCWRHHMKDEAPTLHEDLL